MLYRFSEELKKRELIFTVCHCFLYHQYSDSDIVMTLHLILSAITDRGCVFLWGSIMYLFTQPMHSSTTPCAYHTDIKNVKLWAGMTLESWSSFIPEKPMLLTKNHACGLRAWAASSLWINISHIRVRQCLIFTFCMSINRIIFPS